MFTGIITDIGIISKIDNIGTSLHVEVACSYNTKNIALGASIAHDGICLTVVKIHDKSYEVDISQETINCTNIANWQVGRKINLERALKVGDELGGHIVSGHIDNTAKLIKIDNINNDTKLTFLPAHDLTKFIVHKGSITINGVSLTVNDVIIENEKEYFTVNIIPHTLENTNLSELGVNDTANIEIDMLARYINKISTRF